MWLTVPSAICTAWELPQELDDEVSNTVQKPKFRRLLAADIAASSTQSPRGILMGYEARTPGADAFVFLCAAKVSASKPSMARFAK